MMPDSVDQLAQALRGIVSELRRHRSGYRFDLSTNQHMKHTLTLTAQLKHRSL